MQTFVLSFIQLLLCFLVNALPPNLEERGGSGGISSTLFNQLAFYEQYAAAAYCNSNASPGSTSAISCSAGNCPLVQKAGATAVLEFSNLGPAECTGFVAVDKQNKLIVLSFRGSESLGSWISDVNIDFASWSSCCQGCSVHAGFLSSWTSSKSVIVPALKQAVSQNPGFQVVVTGHSLGGAIATLAAAELRSQGLSIALYTYGSPMVGNSNFANFVTNQQGGNYRVTHAADIVPQLPGYLLGYRHVSPEYWITSPCNTAPTASNIKVSSGTLDFSGNEGQLFPNLADHLWYFNFIGGCVLSDFSLKKKDLSEDAALTYVGA